jgi:hypothetical protein
VDDARQPFLHCVVEVENALADQLQDDGGGERLGGAADPELVVRLAWRTGVEVGDPGRAEAHVFAIANLHRDAGNAGLPHRLIQQPLDLGPDRNCRGIGRAHGVSSSSGDRRPVGASAG